MDAPRVDELLSRAIDDQVAEYREWRLAVDALGERMARLESAVQALRDDLGTLPELVRAATASASASAAAVAEAQTELDLRDEAALPYADAVPVGRRGRFRRR